MIALNVASESDDWRARRISNFPAYAFELDGGLLASVEGFIQGTKFPEGHPTRELAFRSVGKEAKRLSKDADRKFVWWQGKTISYGSQEHHKLIERAIRAKFEQNPGAMMALLATEGMILTHDLGEQEPPNTSLPAKVFCEILSKIREEQTRK